MVIVYINMKKVKKNIVISDKAYMCSQAGENASPKIPATKTIIHNGKTYYVHPLYMNFAASEDGYNNNNNHNINRKTLKPSRGRLRQDGYFDISVRNKLFCTRKQAHRMIWEAVNQQLIPDKYQIHHINCDKQNNSIENLELVTRQKNMKYEGLKRKGMNYKSKQNVEMKCDVFYYHHIYTNFGANKYGQIYNKKTNRVSIGNLKPNGYMKITLSQIGLTQKTLCIHRLVYECFNGQISLKMQINHIDSNKQNNCIDNLELMTRSENMKHAHEAKKYKTKIEITSDQPIESIKLEIKMKESDDEFTENEKQLIDKKYNAMMKKINNGNFPYQKQLQDIFRI